MKIANKIGLFFLITASILMFTVISVIYVETKKSLRDAISVHLVTAIQSRTRRLETFLKEQKNGISQLSQSFVLRSLLSVDKQGVVYKEMYNNAIKKLQGTKKISEAVSEIFVLDAYGKIIVSSDERKTGLDRSTDAYFLGGKSGPYIKDVYFSQTTGGKLLTVSAPIIDDKTGSLLGVVVERMNLDLLEKITTCRIGLGKTGEIYLVNQYGYMITPSRFIKDTFLKQKINSENVKEAFADVKKSGDKTHGHHPFSYKNYKGVDVWGVHDHITEMKWVLIAEIDEKEAMAPLTRLRLFLFVVFIVTFLLAWLIGIVMAKFITGPIHKLHEGTEIIGDGNLDYKMEAQANDEIGQLARAFNKMTDDLRDTSVSKDYVNNIFTSMTDALVVISPEGKIITLNRAICGLLGYGEEELIGKDVNFLFVEEEISRAETKMGGFIKGGEGELTNYETNYKTKNGTKIPVLLNCSVMKNKEGDITNIVCVARDITERKQAERELRESEEKVRTLYDSSSDAIMLLDDKGFFDCNEATLQLFGCATREEFCSRHPADLSPPTQPDGTDSMSYARNNITVALKEGNKRFEHLHRRLDGTDFSAEVLLDAMVLSGKKVLQARVFDITERKKAEHALKKANKDLTANELALKHILGDLQKTNEALENTQNQLLQSEKMVATGQLAAGVAHEIKNPLAIILMSIESMEDVIKNLDEKSQRRIQMVVEAAERANKIVNELLVFSRRTSFHLKTVNLREIIAGAVILARNIREDQDVNILEEVEEDEILLEGDHVLLEQAFLNLFVNAIDSMDGGGGLGIKIFRDGGSVKERSPKDIIVEVSDTGSGIPGEEIKDIFTPFFTTKEQGKGTGLGLSTVYIIINERHKGDIKVESKVGVGTKFIVTLPASQTVIG
ncbi:MAG: PAS domain S-box protein [Candidatus Omnitrophica bacterium]|nr:PAS domain S-box protein [Candidatus Omnitrophota bacterium]